MTAFNLSIHSANASKFSADVKSREGTHWVTFHFDKEEFTIFTEAREQAVYLAAGFRKAFLPAAEKEAQVAA